MLLGYDVLSFYWTFVGFIPNQHPIECIKTHIPNNVNRTTFRLSFPGSFSIYYNLSILIKDLLICSRLFQYYLLYYNVCVLFSCQAAPTAPNISSGVTIETGSPSKVGQRVKMTAGSRLASDSGDTVPLLAVQASPTSPASPASPHSPNNAPIQSPIAKQPQPATPTKEPKETIIDFPSVPISPAGGAIPKKTPSPTSPQQNLMTFPSSPGASAPAGGHQVQGGHQVPVTSVTLPITRVPVQQGGALVAPRPKNPFLTSPTSPGPTAPSLIPQPAQPSQAARLNNTTITSPSSMSSTNPFHTNTQADMGGSGEPAASSLNYKPAPAARGPIAQKGVTVTTNIGKPTPMPRNLPTTSKPSNITAPKSSIPISTTQSNAKPSNIPTFYKVPTPTIPTSGQNASIPTQNNLSSNQSALSTAQPVSMTTQQQVVSPHVPLLSPTSSGAPLLSPTSSGAPSHTSSALDSKHPHAQTVMNSKSSDKLPVIGKLATDLSLIQGRPRVESSGPPTPSRPLGTSGGTTTTGQQPTVAIQAASTSPATSSNATSVVKASSVNTNQLAMAEQAANVNTGSPNALTLQPQQPTSTGLNPNAQPQVTPVVPGPAQNAVQTSPSTPKKTSNPLSPSTPISSPMAAPSISSMATPPRPGGSGVNQGVTQTPPKTQGLPQAQTPPRVDGAQAKTPPTPSEADSEKVTIVSSRCAPHR